jgi:hypothetical protein
MPRAAANKNYNTFLRGLITEAGPLTFPEDATVDELNCELFITGSRKRRKGFNLEDASALSTQTVNPGTWANYAIDTSNWVTVGGDGNTNFLVVQIGPTLYFYDQSKTPLSAQQKSFTVNLIDFTAPSASDIGGSIVTTTSGKGFLFVVGEKIEPFFIEYDSFSDTIATTLVDIEIRDFEGVDDGLDPDEEPTVLSNEHSYNLKNQGWNKPREESATIPDPVDTYFTSESTYPPNSKQWWTAKDSSNDFSPTIMAKFSAGNTLAPKGHFIINAFNKDRASASGISGLTTEAITSRPNSVTFFAGRVWYSGVSGDNINGHIFYSQIIEDSSKVGKCHQINDPTAEDLNILLDTDGGVIVIPEISSVLALFPMRNDLVVLATNGVWTISGTDGGFKATDFLVSKKSSIGIVSATSLIDVEGAPVWWSETGINTLVPTSEVTQELGVSDITKDTIQTFFNDISSVSKKNVKGAYDPLTKKAVWLYQETDSLFDQDKYRFNRALWMDIRLQAFYPWKIEQLATNPYFIGSVFQSPSLIAITDSVDVTDGGVNVTDSAVQVTASDFTDISNSTFIQYMCFREASTVQWTFGNFDSLSFFDWLDADAVGVPFESFFESGNDLLDDLQRLKQAKYVQVFFNRTETAYTDGTFTAFVRPSGCLMQAKWEWSDSSNSHKWSPKIQVYKFRRTYTPASGTDYDSGFPVTATRNKIRGSGRALRLRFESQEGKDFDILGWAISFSGNTEE